MPDVRHILTYQDTHVPLTHDEARIVMRGEIPRGLVTLLKQRGVRLPERGTVQYHLEIVYPDHTIRTKPRMRRLPTWPSRRRAA